MEPTDQFIINCIRTNTQQKIPIPSDLLHATLGLVTEAGEFADQVKKFAFYGKPLDTVNLEEELGDMLWYMSIACHYLDTHFPDIMDKVINKLRVRYPDRFNSYQALNRDLNAERKTLER